MGYDSDDDGTIHSDLLNTDKSDSSPYIRSTAEKDICIQNHKYGNTFIKAWDWAESAQM